MGPMGSSWFSVAGSPLNGIDPTKPGALSRMGLTDRFARARGVAQKQTGSTKKIRCSPLELISVTNQVSQAVNCVFAYKIRIKPEDKSEKSRARHGDDTKKSSSSNQLRDKQWGLLVRSIKSPLMLSPGYPWWCPPNVCWFMYDPPWTTCIYTYRTHEFKPIRDIGVLKLPT